MKITRIVYSKNLNQGKYDALKAQADLLGNLRSEVWQRFGSIAGIDIKDRAIRDLWLEQKRDFSPLNATAWKETLRDSIANIAVNREAAKVNARSSIRRHTSDKVQQKRLYTLLKSDKWQSDKYLTRIMRKHCHRGHNRTHNQIIVRSDNYVVFQKGGKAWLSIPSLVKGKRIAIPLSSCFEPSGTLRIILRNNKVEIHFAVDVEIKNDCGTETIGIDKGYTEVFVDSDGVHYGEGLGNVISQESDYLKKKYQARNKILAIANKSDPVKKNRIIKNNLGKQKLNSHRTKVNNKIRTIIFTATNELIDKAGTVIAEDLTSPISSRSFGKNMNRRLSFWTKGVIAEALNTISQRRSSSLHLVNAAYTSQIDHRTGCLTGKRKGDRFYCEDGVIMHADGNAAKNVLARFHDLEIGRWTNYKQVKSILLRRTDSYRLGLLNQDSSLQANYLESGKRITF